MKEKLHSLDNVKFLLALLVVFIHTSGREHLFPSDVSVVYAVVEIMDHICTIAVPGFFVLAGYLLLYGVERYDRHVYLAKMRKRIATLLVPYLVWNTLKLCSLLLPVIVFHHQRLADAGAVLDEFHWLGAYWNGNSSLEAPVLLATWFIRDLMVFSLLSPLLYHANRLSAYTLPLVLFCFHALGAWPSENVCGVKGLAFFTLGMALAQKKLPLLLWKNEEQYRWLTAHKALIISAVGFVLSFVMMFASDIFFEQSYAVSSLSGQANFLLRQGIYVATNDLAIALSLFFVIQAVDVLYKRYGLSLSENMTSGTYFIYMCHSFLVHSGVCAVVGFIFSQGSAWAALVRYLLPPFITVSLLVKVHHFVLNKFPRLMRILTGEGSRRRLA